MKTEEIKTNLQLPEVCPKCGSIFIDWDWSKKRFRCLVRDCNWVLTKFENEPLKNNE